MTGRAGSVLGRVARVARAAAAGGSAPTDRELLRRFAHAGDEAAFAELVRRHGRMVLGVCRRLLPTAEDAEDACQAAFLILARKAGAGSWQESVANWLHTTARRVAAKARLAAGRRARREARAAASEAISPLDAITGRELLAVLDEELNRLPARYREPLVLCYLEGLGRDEAAARLGLPPGTVKTRLERGRKRLGAALAGRGVAPGVGLLALSAAGAGEPPVRLVEAIRTAATGSPPPAVAALARETAASAMIGQVMVAVAVAAGGLGVVWAAAGPAAETTAVTPVPVTGTAPLDVAAVAEPVQPADPKFRAGVAEARRKAVKFLTDRQTAEGTWEDVTRPLLTDMDGGVTALVALALLEAGVPPTDPPVKKAVEYLAKLPPKKTYVVGLQTQVLARAGPKAHAARIQANADWLLARGLGLGGGKLAGWSYPANFVADNSNTHFAVFGLHAAAGAGAEVDGWVWAAIRDYYVRTRLAGGWPYHRGEFGDNPNYSMTAAALAGLAVADKHTMRPTPAGREAFDKGLGALLAMSVENSKSVGYSWLVTAELGRAVGSPVFKSGDREVNWYRAIADKLIRDQLPDGSWVPGKGVDAIPVLGTAFGLYFLGPPEKE